MRKNPVWVIRWGILLVKFMVSHNQYGILRCMGSVLQTVHSYLGFCNISARKAFENPAKVFWLMRDRICKVLCLIVLYHSGDFVSVISKFFAAWGWDTSAEGWVASLDFKADSWCDASWGWTTSRVRGRACSFYCVVTVRAYNCFQMFSQSQLIISRFCYLSEFEVHIEYVCWCICFFIMCGVLWTNLNLRNIAQSDL